MAEQLKAIFCIIHNGDIRAKFALEQLEKLGLADANLDAKVIQHSFQPLVVPHSKTHAWRRKLIYRRLSNRWAKYRELPPETKKITKEVSFYRRSLKSWLKNRHSVTGWQIKSAIEVNVTDKHIRGWASFLETDADFLLMMEDDAVFDADTFAAFEDVLMLVRDHKLRNAPLYIYLAGGCSLQELKIHFLQREKISKRFRSYERPVTNTACCYVLSRKLVEHFISQLIEHPEYRLIGIDWMMNQLFIDLLTAGVVINCIHAEPPIIRHGSVTGDFVSWQEDYS